MPLKAGKVETRLEINSAELGLYTYMLSLNALPARPERTIYFKAPLGNSQVLTAKFTSYARTKTDYVCKVSSFKLRELSIFNISFPRLIIQISVSIELLQPLLVHHHRPWKSALMSLMNPHN
jgi:hypothetical protein